MLPILFVLSSPSLLSPSTVNKRCVCRRGSARNYTNLFSLRACVRKQAAFWVEPQTQEVLTTALEGGITDFFFRKQLSADKWSTLGLFTKHILAGSSGTFDGGRLIPIAGVDDVTLAESYAGNREKIVLDKPLDEEFGWKNIPAENLIAAYQNTPTQLFVVVSDVPTAKAMLGSLEVGVDGVVLQTGDVGVVSEYISLSKLVSNEEEDKGCALEKANIVAIKQIGTGERVCIDTCSILKPEEGVFVGSSSQCMGVVLSEAATCEYISSRPFRVNAGAVHMYVKMAGGKTKYLEEICAGDTIVVYDTAEKRSRNVVVGRSKIETRPLLMITVSTQGDNNKDANVFVQNAETVRIAMGDGTMKSVAQLKVGHEIVVRTESVARHIGLAIDENIVEK